MRTAEAITLDAVILNAGSGAWAFETHAAALSRALGVPASATPARFNYLLGWDADAPPPGACFVPFEAIEIATDKRATARCFARHGVPTPETHLFETDDEVQTFLAAHAEREWLLKWPVGCGAAGHRFVAANDVLPTDWPHPFVVQAFVRTELPEVFRLYGVASELFGWNARRFAGENDSQFVAHARGAHYDLEGEAPPEAQEATRLALEATNLHLAFGCANLMRDDAGRWLVLEVNTDGRWMHVDRDVPSAIASEIEQRLAVAFRQFAQGI